MSLYSITRKVKTAVVLGFIGLIPLANSWAVPCSGVNWTVAGVSDSVFYVDLSPPAGGTPITSGYLGYAITNNTGSNEADLWVQVENVAGGHLALATNEDGLVHVGPIANGATKTVYFFFTADANNATNQTHDIVLYPSNPSPGNDICGDGFTFSTDGSQQALANKVDDNGVSVSPNPPELGREVVVTVTGETGTVSNQGHFWFSPAIFPTWRADAYELVKVDMNLGGVLYSDVNYVNTPSLSNTAYTQTYRFVVKGGTGGQSTTVSPMSHIHSGGQMKHNSTSNFGTLLPLQAPVSKVTVSSLVTSESFNGACFPNGTGGPSQVTVTISNSSLGAITLDDIIVTLPAGVTFDNTVTPVYDSANLANPGISSGVLTWYYPFTVPAATMSGASVVPSTKTLTFGINVQSTNGVYDLSAVGHIDTTQIDSTESFTDNAPQSGFTCVGPFFPTPTPTATATPTAVPADTDTDDDGITDAVEGTTDKDGDGIPNHQDLDSDNDAIPDIIEGGGTDSNGDGIADSSTDTDGDGLVDQYDPDNGGNTQPTPDTDGDGGVDFLDLDSDGDGISDLIEGGGTDTNGDGKADSNSDTDGDGFSDQYDPTNGGSKLPVPDTDGDGKLDYREKDSDGDGISDPIEGHDPYVPPSGSDGDGDGIDNAYDKDSGGSSSSPTDTDRDGKPDYQDLDSDGDGTSDTTEAFDFNGDGKPDVVPSGIDANGDGIDDAFSAYNTPSTLSDEWRETGSCTLKNVSRRVSKVADGRSAIHGRAQLFAARARSCNGINLSGAIAKSASLS